MRVISSEEKHPSAFYLPNPPRRRKDAGAFRKKQGTSPRVKTVICAGGIIFRRKDHGIEIFFFRDPFGRFTFPKGKQELGETLVQTSIREIREETGLQNLRFIAPIGKSAFRFRREGLVYEKNVYFFLFEAPGSAEVKLAGDAAIAGEARWIKAHQAFAASSYRNLDRLLSKALRLIAQEERRNALRERGNQR